VFGRYRVRLVDGAHEAWRWSSMRFLALGMAAQGAVVTCPAQVAQHVPEVVWQALSCFALLCIFLAGAGRITHVEKHDVRDSDTPNPGS